MSENKDQVLIYQLHLAYLLPTKQIADFDHAVMSCGELQLDGIVRPMKAGISAVITALEFEIEHFVFHSANVSEGKITRHGKYLTVEHLSDLQQAYKWDISASIHDESHTNDSSYRRRKQYFYLLILSYSKSLKRVMTIAAAGRHNVLIVWSSWHRKNSKCY